MAEIDLIQIRDEVCQCHREVEERLNKIIEELEKRLISNGN